MRLLSEPLHRLCHPIHEECLCFILTAVAVARGNQFIGLGRGECGKQVGEYRAQRTAQPDVEEVREIGVADVVVVGRVGGDDQFPLTDRLCLSNLPERPDQKN